MSLDDLQDDVQGEYSDLDEVLSVDTDRETRNELAMLLAALDTDDPDELVRRGIHMLFQSAVETGNLDFHLRSEYDVTYDEYLLGATMDTYNDGGVGSGVGPDDPDDRRYQF
ncbi:hypothetical protein C475_11685 [Halosimplex carlsbadense 2-9-1]|uniref:Uncharacterized protein n=1 Tax=Halosimplex carlsbadense 2-9-1 TaxID=797114 RepID=M0CNS0_9EURY|nr:hypothetical protein [Halosimplex carlsbadense]ELZ24896.1 hypothetical protein C475_11685 [Halosimplex carlsbadense 2-9-1]